MSPGEHPFTNVQTFVFAPRFVPFVLVCDAQVTFGDGEDIPDNLGWGTRCNGAVIRGQYRAGIGAEIVECTDDSRRPDVVK